jgi:hypothetical protein
MFDTDSEASTNAYKRGYAAGIAGKPIDPAEWRGNTCTSYQDGYGRGLLAKIIGEPLQTGSAAASSLLDSEK